MHEDHGQLTDGDQDQVMNSNSDQEEAEASPEMHFTLERWLQCDSSEEPWSETVEQTSAF
jgi:hypothetical protein